MISSEESVPLPFAIAVIIVLELIVFTPFALKFYLSGFNPGWQALSTKVLGQVEMWKGCVQNGSGVCVILFALSDVLLRQRMTRLEVELLLLSHSLWSARWIMMSPPWPLAVINFVYNPHVPLTIMVFATTWSFVRPFTYILSVGLLLSGVWRHLFQFRPAIATPYTYDAYIRHVEEVHGSPVEEKAPRLFVWLRLLGLCGARHGGLAQPLLLSAAAAGAPASGEPTPSLPVLQQALTGTGPTGAWPAWWELLYTVALWLSCVLVISVSLQ